MRCVLAVATLVPSVGIDYQKGLICVYDGALLSADELFQPRALAVKPVMNQPADKPKVYFNLFDTFAKIATQEGPPALWRGFIPMWARIAPTTTLQLLFFEKFSKLAGISAT